MPPRLKIPAVPVVAFVLAAVMAARGESAPITAVSAPAEKALPISTGNLFSEGILCEYAIYLLPGSTENPGDVLAKLLPAHSSWTSAAKLPQKAVRPTLVTHLITDATKSYKAPDLHSLEYFGRDLSKEQAAQVQSCDKVYVLTFVYPAKDAWKSLRSATTLAGKMGAGLHGLIWDEATRELFSPEGWDKLRVATWPTEGVPDLSKQVTMHAYKDGDYVRAITLGMSKCGLPDAVVNGFVWSDSRQMGNLINLLCQTLAEGAQLKTPGEFDLDIRNIKESGVRQRMTDSLLEHASSTAKLGLKVGKLEEGDDENRLIEITFDRYEGADVHSRQSAMISDIFGWKDDVKSIRHNDEVLAASAHAREKLPELRSLFQKGLSPGEFIQVKAPFKGTDGRTEWMWVEVVTWNGDAIHGMLKNEPYFNPTLHAGQPVDVSEKALFDYLHIFPDGHEEGNETGPIIEKIEEGK
jgi:uncharacterized protein YegJ (DUF2314 family)